MSARKVWLSPPPIEAITLLRAPLYLRLIISFRIVYYESFRPSELMVWYWLKGSLKKNELPYQVAKARMMSV